MPPKRKRDKSPSTPPSRDEKDRLIHGMARSTTEMDQYQTELFNLQLFPIPYGPAGHVRRERLRQVRAAIENRRTDIISYERLLAQYRQNVRDVNGYEHG